MSSHGENGPGTMDDTGFSPAAAEHQEAGVLKKHSSWETAGPQAVPLWVWALVSLILQRNTHSFSPSEGKHGSGSMMDGKGL